MPSPFPGTDPYLEGELWTNFHTQFAVEIARQLNPRLAPRYVAVTEKYQNSIGPEEITIGAHEMEPMIPDVGIAQISAQPRSPSGLATLNPPLQIETVISISVAHVWIKIVDVNRRQLVTAIEFLSPTSKKGKGRLKYLRKRRRLLLSSAHLIEIDLQRNGRRVPMAEPLPAAPYFVLLNRIEQKPELDVWPIPLDQCLPKIPIPLLKGDEEVALDLQGAFTAVYDTGNMEYLRNSRMCLYLPKPSNGPREFCALLASANRLALIRGTGRDTASAVACTIATDGVHPGFNEPGLTITCLFARVGGDKEGRFAVDRHGGAQVAGTVRRRAAVVAEAMGAQRPMVPPAAAERHETQTDQQDPKCTHGCLLLRY